MNDIIEIKRLQNDMLKEICDRNQIQPNSMRRLLDAEKTKKFFKRNSLMQQNIDKEIEESLENENR